MNASTVATGGLQGRAQAMPTAEVPFRVRARWSALWLAAALLTTACASTSAPVVERGVRRCDRNGDYEERMSCNP